MGLFQKTSASKLFSSSFAIDTAESTAESTIDANETAVDQAASPAATDSDSDTRPSADDIHAEDIVDGDFEPIEKTSESIQPDQSLSISQVVQLVRSLPQQGTEVELHAVLRTLELFEIDVHSVLNDSHRKQTVTGERINMLLSEISTLDEEIDKRAKEIKMLEVGITEMTRVNECLELMLKLDAELYAAEQNEQEQNLIENLSIDEGQQDADTDIEAQLDSCHSDSSKEISVNKPQGLEDVDEDKTGKKSARERLDDYVKKGQSQTLDGIVIDLDSPPKKLRLPKKAKISKRKNKKMVEEEEQS